MKNKTLLVFLLLPLFSALSFGQKPAASPDENDVVKITSKLVQLDAVVTDKDGNPVTDLKREDFEILEDGKPQKITGFTYVSTDPATYVNSEGDSKTQKPGTMTRPMRAPTSAHGRTITFIIDDGNCFASQLGILNAKQALEKFINEQMLPIDLVAIYQTRSGNSLFQQYSSDKTQLLRAARRIRWYPPIGSCPSSDGSFYEAGKSNIASKITPGGIKSTQIESDDNKKTRQASEDFNSNNQVVGILGVLRYVVRGLQ